MSESTEDFINLPAFCSACGEYLCKVAKISREGSVKIIPLCKKCFEERIGDFAEPKDYLDHTDD